MNKLILIGNLCSEPQLSSTGSGISYCKLSVAVSRRFANQDGERETDFFNITTWRAVAENCGKYLSKGSKVAIVGSIQNRTYEDKEGNKRTVTDIIADEVEFLSTKKGEQAEIETPKRKAELKPVLDDQLSDLPF